MVPRLVAPHIAHAATADMQCRAKLKFPCDKQAAQCALRSAHVLDKEDGPAWHVNSAGTRRWRRVGYDTEAMFAPGTEGQP